MPNRRGDGRGDRDKGGGSRRVVPSELLSRHTLALPLTPLVTRHPPLVQSVQTFGRKKTAVAVAYVKRGKGEIRLNGAPLDVIQPDTLRWKVMEPILLLGKQRFSQVDIRLRVKGGGRVAQSYALRQAIAKGLVAFYQKYVDEQSKNEIKNILLSYDRSLIVADPRRCEPKKFGGKGARSRFQKSYR